MRVYINRKVVDIFQGATLGDVVLAYSKRCFKMVMSGYLDVYDRFGYLTSVDGAVSDGQHFTLKVAKKKFFNKKDF
jgi:hypothetical protein